MSEHSMAGTRQEISDEEFIKAVQDLYPAETISGGVKASQIATHLDLSNRRARTRLRRLQDAGRIRSQGGLRGPTYAPLTDEQDTRHVETPKW